MTEPKFNPNLLKVPLYIGGKSIEAVKEEMGLETVVKMASNESPIGPSPMGVAAARAALANAHRYPGVGERDLRRKLAERLGRGLAAANFVIGNGGTDVLRMIAQAFVFDGGNTVMSRASFPVYRIATETFGGEMRQVAPTADLRHDLAAMAAQIDDDTRIVFLCSPNNPTGHIITQAEAEDFMARVPPHVVVIFDESYCDFVTAPDYADSLAYVADGRNVLVVRSFSKTAGLAGLRCGYLVGRQELADYVRHAQLPFHTSDVVLAAAAASMDDETFLAEMRAAVVNGREYLHQAICELGLTCLPSQTNFVVILDPPMGANELADALLRRGYIVRAMGAFGLPNGVRVSVGSQAENEGFLAALQAVLEGV